MQHAGPLQAVRHPLPWLLQRALQPLAHLQCGSLLLEMPDGRQMQFQGPRQGPSAFIKIRSYRLARRLAAGDVGLAEGYIQGDWDTPDIVSVLLLLTGCEEIRAQAHAATFLRTTISAISSTPPGSTPA
jgi:hypothetical protein